MHDNERLQLIEEHLGRISREMASLVRLVGLLVSGEERIMSTLDDFLPKLDAATTKIGAGVASLKAELADAGKLTPEQDAKMAAIVAHLEAIGADAANPLPTPDPVITVSTESPAPATSPAPSAPTT